MIKYEGFSLPADGITRIAEIGDYYANQLHKEGWAMVGMCQAEDKLYGVYRMTADDALRKALEDTKKAEDARSTAEAKVYKLEADAKEAEKKIARLVTSQSGELIEAARKKFGEQFKQLEVALGL